MERQKERQVNGTVRRRRRRRRRRRIMIAFIWDQLTDG